MSSRMANRLQQAAFVAVFTPSGHVTRLVIAAANNKTNSQQEQRNVIDERKQTFDAAKRDSSEESGEELFEGHDR